MNWRDLTNPSAGGAELVTHEIAKKWVEMGNEVRLLTSKYPASASEESIDDVIVTRVGGKYSVYVASARRFLREFFRSYDVIVDQINSVPFFTPLYCRTPIVPFVFQMTREIYFRELPRVLSSLAVRLEPLLFRLYAGSPTVVLSESTKRDLISIGFPDNRVFVCPPGVDHEKFATGKKTPYPSVLYLNRFVKYKNPDQLMIAFREVLKVVPDCKLTMVGARTKNEIRSFSSLAHELRIKDSVEILPFARGESKIMFLQRSWVHALPSMREGWGISILEAAACGTPTVGYDVPGVRDAVRHMETGLLVANISAHPLAKAIITLLQYEELRKSLSAGAAKWASNFTWDSTAKEAMRALITALGQREYQDLDRERARSHNSPGEVQGNP